MLLTINANAALDNVLYIDRFRPGETMRPQRVVTSVGGKGLDVAVVLQALGAPVQAISFAAGRNGETLAELLAAKQIPVTWLWVPGETRLAHVIVETELKRHSHITTPGYELQPTDLEDFQLGIGVHAAHASWAIMAGSLPGGAPHALYHDIIKLVHRYGAKTLIDCAGDPLLAALPALPEIVKMNQAEFAQTFGERAQDQPGWVAAVRWQMQRHNIRNFVLTCGRAGLLAFTPGQVYQAQAPQQTEVNAAGSGDAASAAITYRLSLGDSWEEALRWAAAAGAAVVLTEGTAECHLADVERIYRQTSVQRIPETS